MNTSFYDKHCTKCDTTERVHYLCAWDDNCTKCGAAPKVSEWSMVALVQAQNRRYERWLNEAVPESIKPESAVENMSEHAYKNHSRYTVVTAGSSNTGLGDTARLHHYSEPD